MVATRDEGLWRAFRKTRELTGATTGALEAYLAVLRARTMALRLERAQQNAQIIDRVCENVRLIRHAISPGRVESTMNAFLNGKVCMAPLCM